VKRHDIDAGRGPAGALTTAERQELTQLRRDNREIRMERDFLKKAAAFFARETK
jgi:transposase